MTQRAVRFSLISGLMACLVALTAAGPAPAQDMRYFRIGTGTSSGTYFTVGGLIAGAISNPPGSRPCERGGSCGVPGLIGVAQATEGGIENLDLLRSGAIEAALVQSNLAFWAYGSLGVYERRPPFADLRAIATLYTETVQIVVRADSPIRAIGDLRGHKVSIGEPGSAFALDARIILGGLGLTEKKYTPVYLRPGASVDQFVDGKIDALFIVGGAPFTAISDAAARVPIRLLAIDAEAAASLRRARHLFTEATVPADVYPGVPETATLGVTALLVVRAGLDEELVRGVTRALWHPSTRRALAQGFPNGSFLPLPMARDDTPIPLHPGAERFYRESDGGAAKKTP